VDYIVPADVKDRFSQFANVDDSVVQTYIDDTKCNFDLSRWDCLYTRGHSLYVAHLMDLYDVSGTGTKIGGGHGGNINSQSADGVSRSNSIYTPESATDSFLMRTLYGQEYLKMRDSVGTGAISLCSN
jgi:hypothetical protein